MPRTKGVLVQLERFKKLKRAWFGVCPVSARIYHEKISGQISGYVIWWGHMCEVKHPMMALLALT